MKAFPGVSQAAKLERFLIPWCKSEFGPVDFSARRNRWPLLPSFVFCHEPVGIVWRYRVLGDLLWCLANCAFQGPLDSFHRAIPLCRGDLEPHTPGVSINQQPSFCGPRRWSTDAVPATQRLDYWVGAISEGFLAMEASGDAHAFHGELVSAPLGPVGVNWVQGAAHRVWRTPRGIARGGQRVAYLLGNHDSAWRVAQDGRDALMRPGDFVLVDARRPYRRLTGVAAGLVGSLGGRARGTHCTAFSCRQRRLERGACRIRAALAARHGDGTPAACRAACGPARRFVVAGLLRRASGAEAARPGRACPWRTA